MTLFFDKIINSAKLSWKGEEKLWKAFCLWGILPYIGSISLGIFISWIFFEIKPSLRIFSTIKLEDFVLFLYALVLIYILPAAILIISSRNIKNISLQNVYLRKLSAFFILMLMPMFFSIIHLIVLSTIGGAMLAWGAIDGDSVGVYFFLSLLLLTIYLNYRFYKNYNQKLLII